MRREWLSRGRKSACWPLVLVTCAFPAAALAAESAPAAARLQVEPSVGASLALSLSEGVIVNVFLPGAPVQVRSRAAVPGMVLSFGDTEVMADSAVSLRIEHRAAATTSLDENGEEQGEGGALVILAQFN